MALLIIFVHDRQEVHFQLATDLDQAWKPATARRPGRATRFITVCESYLITTVCEWVQLSNRTNNGFNLKYTHFTQQQ